VSVSAIRKEQMKRSVGVLRPAQRTQARRAGDFGVANPKWWYEIFDTISFFRFASALRSEITTRKAGSSAGTERGLLALERLIRISNFWALTARSLICKSAKVGKSLRLLDFGPAYHAGGRGFEPVAPAMISKT
jgi:hypothetical protein